jgi:hypothetical protein
VASIDSDGAVVPCYYDGLPDRKKTSWRTLERLIIGADDDDDDDEKYVSVLGGDDDDNDDSEPTLWIEELPTHFPTTMPKDGEHYPYQRHNFRQNNPSFIRSETEIGLAYDDTASSTRSNLDETVSSTDTPKKSNSMFISLPAMLFGAPSSHASEESIASKLSGTNNRDEASTTSSTKVRVGEAVSLLHKQVSKKFLEMSVTVVTPAVSSLQKSVSLKKTVSKRPSVANDSVTKDIFSRPKSGASATEASTTTPTSVTNHESMMEYPDLEALEDIIFEAEDEDTGDATISSTSHELKEELVNPRTLLWVVMVSMVVLIVVIFVAMVSVYAQQA